MKPDSHAERFAALRRAVLESPGVTGTEMRKVAAEGGHLDEPLSAYLTKVREESFRVTDRDMEDLKSAGLNEDEIFELTIAAALGSAARRLDAGLKAMHGGS